MFLDPTSLDFHVGFTPPERPETPVLLLRPDKWDDYSHRTSFDLELYRPNENPIAIGPVKILGRDLPAAPDGKYYTANALKSEFQRLDPDSFCSLGQSSNYYIAIRHIDSTVANGFSSWLTSALNDISCSPNQDKWWERAEGYRLSLLRFPDARIALVESRTLLLGGEAGPDNVQSIDVEDLHPDMILENPTPRFEFNASNAIPSRINVLVGRNGVGKSRLLSELAKRLSGEGSGRVPMHRPSFSRVIYVSYNAFDEAARGIVEWRRSSLRFVGYKPGRLEKLHEVSANAAELDEASWGEYLVSAFSDPEEWLSSAPALVEDEKDIPRVVRTPKGLEFLERMLENASLSKLLVSNPVRALQEMSPGQRVLTGLYASLYVNMDRRSLVLMDEPENHLHPSMLAAFARGFSELLQQQKSYAIVVTHSPVLVQETLSRDVLIMSRDGGVSSLSHPQFETFGESLDSITQYLFETDFRNSNWKAVLHRLVSEGKSMADIEVAVGGPTQLSLLARTFLNRLLIERDDDEA